MPTNVVNEIVFGSLNGKYRICLKLTDEGELRAFLLVHDPKTATWNPQGSGHGEKRLARVLQTRGYMALD